MVYIWLVLTRGPLFAGMTTYVVPVIALLWGTLDHEVISGQQALAIAGVLGMVALVQSGAKRSVPVLERAVAGEFVASLPLAGVADGLVTLPMREIPLTDRRAVSAQSQVA
jgi:4-amino-4-deoxy-L-arabinose transferase-like glycosyltransferase